MSITEDGVGNSVIALDWRADLIESWAIEAGNLVLVSGFDSNDWDVRKVTVNNVYGDTAYPRSLQNSKLTFITKDGFHWVPDLPDSIEHDNWLAIEAVMVQQGTPQNPAILNDKSEQSIAHDKDTSYYVSRLIELTTLNIKQKSEYSTTLHLDYAPSELTRIEAHYNAHVIQEDESDTVKYGACGLTLYFGNRRVIVNNLASSDERYTARKTATGRRAFSALGPNHTVILILNDGSSYRLALPTPDYGLLLDRTFIDKNPVKWKAEVPLPLTPTKRNTPIFSPWIKSPITWVTGRPAPCSLQPPYKRVSKS
ncbi:hypothetical protein QZH46_00400 [Pseudomonas corrugata]